MLDTVSSQANGVRFPAFEKTADVDGPAAVDLHVGRCIRQRRRDLGRSQEWLADQLGLTFQQVQKYERGANRVSASKLFGIAQALDCQVGDFFPATDAEPVNLGDNAARMAETSTGEAMQAVWLSLSTEARKALLTVAEAIAAAARGSRGRA